MQGTVLAIDLATAFGWAEGAPGEKPISGSERFAPPGSSDGAVGAAAIKWAADRFAVSRPRTIFIERPGLYSVAKGKSSVQVIQRLLGLCFLVQAVAYRRGIYDVRYARADEVRKHFLGSRKMSGEAAKRSVSARCKALGWEHRDYDESDALALWSYGCDQIRPGSGASPATGDLISAAQAKDMLQNRRK